MGISLIALVVLGVLAIAAAIAVVVYLTSTGRRRDRNED